MKKTILQLTVKARLKAFLFTVLVIGIGAAVNAQVLATFPLRTANAVNNNTPQGQAQVSLTNANVVTGTLASGASTVNTYNATGYRVKTTGVQWAGVPINGYHFDIPIKPAAGYDMNINGLKLDVTYADFDVTGSKFTIVPYFQVNGAGPWLALGTSQQTGTTGSTGTINFGPVNETFYNTKNYVVRFYVSSNDFSATGKNDELRIMNLIFNGTVYQPPALPVTVQTLTAVATGKYTANATGSYDYNANQYYLVKQSGMIWSTDATGINTADTSLATKTSVNSSANGNIVAAITGLSAGTTYYVKAYIVTQLGIQYGAVKSFTTSGPTVPTVTTNAISNVLSNKATGGGAIPDSGGLNITAKGLVWNTTGSPTLASNTGKIILGSNYTSFSDFMKGLAPSTNYCYRAYATNSLGTSYGPDVCFTTAAPAPVLVAVPGTINFGNNYFGAPAISVSYNLSGSSLTPASGNITISIPATAGFKISLSSNPSSFGTASITLPYTGGKLPKTPIFVQFPTGTYGCFTGVITHSGGGVAAADADVVNVKGCILPSPDDVTNKGDDFWLGFAYQNKMTQASSSANKPYLTVYVAAGPTQDAIVTVETPGIPGGYLQSNITVPKGTTRSFVNFPDGAVAGVDSRLYNTGISNKGIHVYTTNGAPISVWMYIATTGNSAGGSMIFPTNTWNSNYTVQSYAGKSNNGLPNSTFFVIANEDNTKVTITPSAGITDPASALTDNPAILYPANVPFTITLNKGQVFNAIGVISGTGNSATSKGFDLSGTTVSTTCDKKVAVFGGNGRCMVTTLSQCTESGVTAGSDNLIQQMIPSVAWDTKYFTVPTKTMEHNLYRIYVKDATQKVWINNESHTTALATNASVNNGSPTFTGNYTFTPFANSPGGYYSLETSYPIEIESEAPISVTQFITAGDCAQSKNNGYANGNNGQGDPEMIILTGAQQAITNAIVYSPSFQNGSSGGGYINVVIPKEGVTTFKLDPATNPTQMVDTGRSSFTIGAAYLAAPLIPIKDAFKPYDANPNYYWAKFHVSYPTTHIMSSTVAFNAIAYGVADGESYGFNAGTAVKNLSSVKISVNPGNNDTSSTVIRTCVNTPITLKIAFPYNPTLVDKIVWDPNDPRVSPNVPKDGAISGGKAVYDGTVVVGGRTFYVYTSPVKYTFSENALYNFTATAYGTFASDCPGQDIQTILVNVGQDNLNLHADPKCNDPKVVFTADTVPMIGTNILSWSWNFGEGPVVTTSPLSPQTHTYPTGGATAYRVKLTTLNSVGCYSTDSLDIDFGGGLKADFTVNPYTVCENVPITFTDNSSGSGTSGSPNVWVWDFDDTKSATGNTPPTQSYSAPGKKYITLHVETPIGCKADHKDSVTVEATPVAKFTATPACLGSDMTFTDASTISVGTVDTRIWTFGEGANTPVTDNNPTIKHKYLTPGKYEVTLSVKSVGGCTSTSVFKDSVTVLPLPKDTFDIDVNCTTKEVTFTDRSLTNVVGSTIAAYNWVIDGTPVTKGASFKQTFNDILNHTVTLTIQTSNGCSNTVGFSRSFKISASPTADFDVPTKVCLPNDAAIFTNKTTISDGTENQISYAWDFGDTKTQNQAAPAPTTISHAYDIAKSYSVKLTATSGAGCTSSTTKTLTNVYAQPKASFTLPTEVCVNAKAALSGTGATGTDWYWNFGTGFGTVSKKDTVGTWNLKGDTAIKHYYVNALGCISDTISKTITVNALPKNGFKQSIDCSNKIATFTDTSSTPLGTTITKRHWVFGDGLRDDGNNATATHTYSGSGPYTATLWVESSKGCQDSSNRATLTFTISAAPASSFTLPTNNICLPAGIATFSNTSTISDGTQASFVNSWEFGDIPGKKDTSIGLAPINHVFLGVGPYTVKLTTTSVNGCNNTATPQIINTIFAQPKATFSAPSETCLNSDAAFSSTGTAAGSTPAQWYWDLGTGSFGTLSKKDTVASWSISGPQSISHYLVSAAGCISDTATKTITVNTLPIASFTPAAVGCAGKVVSFTDGSSATLPATVVEWKWYFGDGQTTTVNTPGTTHTYALGGSYDAKLVVKDSKGCYSDTFRLTVNVYPNPVPLFTVTDICLPSINPVFTDASTITSGSVTDWKWTLGDNTDTLHLSTFTHVYTVGNTYQVTLTAISDQGCSTTGAPVNVTATSAPIAQDSVVNAANLCSSTPVTLINESVPNGFGTVSKIEIFWDNAGDITQKTVDNAPASQGIYTHKYPDLSADKNYDVLIRAYSNNGCFKDSIRTISLLASPKLDFKDLGGICEEKDTLQLAIPNDANGLTIDTAFFSGDGIIEGTNKFFPLLAGPGNHIITYTDTAANGCSSKDTSAIFVYATPTIRMDKLRTVLQGDNVTLNPTVTGNIQTYTWTPDTYLDNPSILKPVSTPAADITYNLNVVTKDGCEADSAVKILVLIDFKVPNTFTPNNDGRNDFWIIEELPRYPIQKVQVFNRYGQVVYETKKYNPRGWDGNYKGKPLPIGTYYYIIEVDGLVQPKVGYVTIIK